MLRDFTERAEELVRVQEHMHSLLATVVSIAEDLSSSRCWNVSSIYRGAGRQLVTAPSV